MSATEVSDAAEASLGGLSLSLEEWLPRDTLRLSREDLCLSREGLASNDALRLSAVDACLGMSREDLCLSREGLWPSREALRGWVTVVLGRDGRCSLGLGCVRCMASLTGGPPMGAPSAARVSGTSEPDLCGCPAADIGD